MLQYMYILMMTSLTFLETSRGSIIIYSEIVSRLTPTRITETSKLIK